MITVTVGRVKDDHSDCWHSWKQLKQKKDSKNLVRNSVRTTKCSV